MTIRHTLRGIAIAAVAAACGRGSSSATDSNSGNAARVAVAPSSTTASTAAKGPPCPATGQWALCSIEKRLKSSGLVAKRIDSAVTPRAGFSVTPVVYALGRDSRLELFIYPSDAALARDIVKMDTVKVAPIGTIGSWSAPPLLIRSANLAAVLLSRDAREADRLSLALTAGAPQPAQ
jgi:hypothetical protein